jgi:hypothetical protein
VIKVESPPIVRAIRQRSVSLYADMETVFWDI